MQIATTRKQIKAARSKSQHPETRAGTPKQITTTRIQFKANSNNQKADHGRSGQIGPTKRQTKADRNKQKETKSRSLTRTLGRLLGQAIDRVLHFFLQHLNNTWVPTVTSVHAPMSYLTSLPTIEWTTATRTKISSAGCTLIKANNTDVALVLEHALSNKENEGPKNAS